MTIKIICLNSCMYMDYRDLEIKIKRNTQRDKEFWDIMKEAKINDIYH